MFPPAGHLAAWAAGGVARAAARSAAQYAAKVSMRKAAIAGAAAAAAGTAATVSSMSKKREPPKRSGGYTSQRGKKYARVGGTNNVSMSSSQLEMTGPHNFTVGRNVRTTVSQLSKLVTFKRVLRWQRVNIMNRTPSGQPPGAIQLKNVPGPTSTETPVHLICLNSTINTTAVQPVHYTLTVNDGGTLSFDPRNSQAFDGTDASTAAWQLESRNNASSGSTGKRWVQPMWYDIRMLCYGCRAQPTRYTITVFRLKDAWLDPLESPSNAQEAAARQAFYQHFAQQNMTNPIMPRTFGFAVQKQMIVLKKISFTLQPSSTTEVDQTPSSKIIKIFMRDGRLYDLLYHPDPFTGAGADDKLNTTQWTPVMGDIQSEYSSVPKPRARLWMMITCTDTTIDAVTDTNTPSYDICIRKGENQPND